MSAVLLLALFSSDVAWVDLPDIPAEAFYRRADSSLCVRLAHSDSVALLDSRSLAIRAVVALPYVEWGWYDPIHDLMYAGGHDGLVVTDCRTWQTIRRPRLNGVWLHRPWGNTAGNRVYAPFWRDSSAWLAVYDTDAGAFTATIAMDRELPEFSCRFTDLPSAARVYCSQYPRGKVTVVDGAADTVIARITDVIMPSALVRDTAANRVYCNNDGDGSTAAIDGAGDTVVATLDAGRWTGPLALAEGTNKLYAVLGDIGTPTYTTPVSEQGLVVLDAARCSIIGAVDSTLSPRVLFYDGPSHRLYCSGIERPTGGTDSSVAIVDCNTDRVVKRIFVGSNPGPVISDPVSGRLLVLLRGETRLAVLPGPAR